VVLPLEVGDTVNLQADAHVPQLPTNSREAIDMGNAMVVLDRETTEAHHIIDILEDLGMNFNGAGDEDVRRVKDLEERDRTEKAVWGRMKVINDYLLFQC
jgi:hypothetical protein